MGGTDELRPAHPKGVFKTDRIKVVDDPFDVVGNTVVVKFSVFLDRISRLRIIVTHLPDGADGGIE